MGSKGLNRAQREIVVGLLERGISENELKKTINTLVCENRSWDYDENVELCKVLAYHKRPEAASYLEMWINSS